LGDTAIAVHPEDPRYQDIIGKTVILPIVNREIPIVGDEYCEMEFGTGAVKITPAHDPNDFEVGKRHNLPVLRVFTDDGHVNEEGGKFCGQDRFECRKNIVKDLEESGNLVKVEDYTHNVGTCYRCHTTIETIVSKQWFVDMKPLAGPAIDMVRSGKVKFVPERFDKNFYHWMENIRDWCISRQLWWGHRIPVYYCDDCGGTFCEETAPEKCPVCGGKLRQDEDVLDTWFSSGLWPFSTLGWPEETEELKYFYPTDTLVTGYDIITFWISRMITFAAEVMKEEPFRTVYVHGLVRDSLGRKMSKSLGNGIDPIDIIEKYGADSLRFSLVTGNAAGNDMRFYTEKVEAARNFCNKVYNAARFVLMNIDEDTKPEFDESTLSIVDKWILAQLDRTIRDVTANLDAYELNLAAEKIYDFIWGTLCDWYIELAKPSLYSDDAAEKARVSSVLLYVLSTSMKLLHPFMPFITEELYQRLPGHAETIMLCDWPKAPEAMRYEAEEACTETLKDVVRAIRNVRAERKVPVGLKIRAKLIVPDPKAFGSVEKLLMKLIGAESVEITDVRGDVQKTDVHLVCSGAEAYIPLASLVDLDEERARIDREIERVKGEVARAEGKLSNEKFVAKAPEAVVNEERRKLEAAKEMLARLTERRADLN
ncbi:MAG: valine--tRNA ligase, partial [Clostridia bacterium]|nr:valine--tRNA ligase [Clostridia bacterium]